MRVVSFILVAWLTVYTSIRVNSAEIKNKPLCLQRWELCMMEQTEPRRTSAECDDLMFERHGCPKPKPWYRGRTSDYDYILTKDTVDNDKELDVQRGHKVKMDQAILEEEQNGRQRKVQDTYVPPARNTYVPPENDGPPPRNAYVPPSRDTYVPPPRNTYVAPDNDGGPPSRNSFVAPSRDTYVPPSRDTYVPPDNDGPPSRNAFVAPSRNPYIAPENDGPPSRNAFVAPENRVPPRNIYAPAQQGDVGPRRAYPQQQQSNVPPQRVYAPGQGQVPLRNVYVPAERRAYAPAAAGNVQQRQYPIRNYDTGNEGDYIGGKNRPGSGGVRRDYDFDDSDDGVVGPRQGVQGPLGGGGGGGGAPAPAVGRKPKGVIQSLISGGNK